MDIKFLEVKQIIQDLCDRFGLPMYEIILDTSLSSEWGAVHHGSNVISETKSSCLQAREIFCKYIIYLIRYGKVQDNTIIKIVMNWIKYDC